MPGYLPTCYADALDDEVRALILVQSTVGLDAVDLDRLERLARLVQDLRADPPTEAERAEAEILAELRALFS